MAHIASYTRQLRSHKSCLCLSETSKRPLPIMNSEVTYHIEFKAHEYLDGGKGLGTC